MSASEISSLTTKDFGYLAELKAVDYLIANGWVVVTRNFIAENAEIDIIVTKGDTLAAVEVKARRQKFIAGYMAVNRSKQEKIISAFTVFLSENSQFNNFKIRFDILCLYFVNDAWDYDYIPGAFN